jgi:hypothetical protein
MPMLSSLAGIFSSHSPSVCPGGADSLHVLGRVAALMRDVGGSDSTNQT